MEGWRVLDRLKNDPATRHIPVCVISTDEAFERAPASGALAFVSKPIKTKETLDQMLDDLRTYICRPLKSLLLVESNASKREELVRYLEADDILITPVPDGQAALQVLREGRTDCMIVNPSLSDLNATLLNEIVEHRSSIMLLPVIIYGDGDTIHEEGNWKNHGNAITVRQVHSPERLLDQTAFFLHRKLTNLPETARILLENLHSSDKVLPGKKVLIVDDDMRNIFALCTVLEEHNMAIVSADNGRDAIRILQDQSDIDIVLMDIMMPEMDGIDTMREIRKIPQLKSLPIIAVTAKAMKGDREKCIEAGATDYIAKPVNMDVLLATLWRSVQRTPHAALQ
jgi:CheY-like chemotaxis protein